MDTKKHSRPGSGLAAAALVALSSAALLAAPGAFGAGSTTVTVSDFQFGPSTAKPAQGGTVAWTFNGPSTHTVTESSALHLFNSGEQRPGGHFSFTFGSAG